MNHSKWDINTLETLDTLIAKGKGVRGMFGSAQGLQEEAFEEWKTSSLDFLLDELGEDSQFYKDFATRVNKATLSTCNIGVGVLTAVKNSLEESKKAEPPPPAAVEKGEEELLEKLRSATKETTKKEPVTTTTPGKQLWKKAKAKKTPAPIKDKEKETQPPEQPHQAPKRPPKKRPVKKGPREVEQPSCMEMLENMLWQAKVQLSQGHKDAAAVLCGAVLEEALKWMCARHNIAAREWDTTGNLSDKLRSKGVYDESMHKKLVSWWYLREDAQSVNFDSYDKKDVATMIKGLQDFLKDYTSTSTPTAQDPDNKDSEVRVHGQ